jgi:glycine cleavage system H protein
VGQGTLGCRALCRPAGGRHRAGSWIEAEEPPEVGSQASKDEAYAEVEPVKAVSDVYASLSGEIVAVNDAMAEKPELVNEDPYGDGWLVRARLSDPSEVEQLMGASAYRELLAEE